MPTKSLLSLFIQLLLPSCCCFSTQDVVAGDGTTSVVVICGALLKKAQELLEKGIHPTVISDSFNKAANKACEVRQASLDAAVSVRAHEGGCRDAIDVVAYPHQQQL